jgi:hypothetical protein
MNAISLPSSDVAVQTPSGGVASPPPGSGTTPAGSPGTVTSPGTVPAGTTLADIFAQDLAAIQALQGDSGTLLPSPNAPVQLPIQKPVSNTWIFFVLIAGVIGFLIYRNSKHKE